MKILSILAIIVSFSQCGSNKFVKNPPFSVQNATFNKWSGGQPGVSGIALQIQLKNASEITFDSLYFQQKRTKVEVSQKGEITQLIGHFSTSKRKEKDLIIDADPKKEMNNTPPIIEKFPFQLKVNEAIVSYKIGEKTVYYKIENVKEEQPKFFPSTNKK